MAQYTQHFILCVVNVTNCTHRTKNHSLLRCVTKCRRKQTIELKYIQKAYVACRRNLLAVKSLVVLMDNCQS